MSAFKFCKGLGPEYMSDIFSLSEIPRTTRRSLYKLKLPLKSTNMGQNGISYYGPKVWNNLPIQCKLEDNPNNFKHKIKDQFFENIQRKNDDIYLYY